MKKLISIVLMLMLIFALAVPSYAIDIGNWPSYYTGQYDSQIFGTLGQILDELDRGLGSIDGTVYDIYTVLFNNVEISQERWNYVEEIIVPYISGIFSHTASLYDRIQIQHDDLMDYYSEELEPNIIGAINGVTSAVNTDAYWNQLNYFNTSDIYSELWDQFNTQQEGHLGYSLYMLQQVLADEDDLALKESQKDNQESAFDNFFDSNASSGKFSTSIDSGAFNSLSSGFSVFATFFGTFSSDDSPLGSSGLLNNGFASFELVFANLDLGDGFLPLGWFSQATADNISSVPSTFSRDPSSRIVTNYYDEQIEKLENFFRGD